MIILLFIAIFIIFILLSISSINIDNKNDVKINTKDTNKMLNIGKNLSINTFNKTKTTALNLFNDAYNQEEYIPVEDEDEIEIDVIINEINDDIMINKTSNIINKFNNIFNNQSSVNLNNSINEVNNIIFELPIESFEIKQNNVILNDSDKRKLMLISSNLFYIINSLNTKISNLYDKTIKYAIDNDEHTDQIISLLKDNLPYVDLDKSDIHTPVILTSVNIINNILRFINNDEQIKNTEKIILSLFDLKKHIVNDILSMFYNEENINMYINNIINIIIVLYTNIIVYIDNNDIKRYYINQDFTPVLNNIYNIIDLIIKLIIYIIKNSLDYETVKIIQKDIRNKIEAITPAQHENINTLKKHEKIYTYLMLYGDVLLKHEKLIISNLKKSLSTKYTHKKIQNIKHEIIEILSFVDNFIDTNLNNNDIIINDIQIHFINILQKNKQNILKLKKETKKLIDEAIIVLNKNNQHINNILNNVLTATNAIKNDLS